MADGTLRLSVDIEPRNAQAAFRLFGAPGTSVALAGIKPVAQRLADEPDKPKGGALAKLAGQWCNDDKFLRFIRSTYDRAMGGDGSGWGDVRPSDFGGDAKQYARHCILVLCGISSRAELDHSAAAAQAFHTSIREPFATYLRDHP